MTFRNGWLTSRKFSAASVLKSIYWHTINASKSTNIPAYISHRYFPHLPETDWKRVGHLANYLTFEDLLALVCVIVYFDSWFVEISQTIDMLCAYKSLNEDHFVDCICSEEKNDAPFLLVKYISSGTITEAWFQVKMKNLICSCAQWLSQDTRCGGRWETSGGRMRKNFGATMSFKPIVYSLNNAYLCF